MVGTCYRIIKTAIPQSVVRNIIVAGLIFMGACSSGNNSPDVSDIKVDLQTKRLDHDLSKIDPNKVGAGLEQLKPQYPDFLDFYLDTLMGFGIQGIYEDSVAGIKLGLKPFLSHKDITGLFDTVAHHFPDTKMIDDDLTTGFRYMKHYYPQFLVPKIIYLITGLNQWSVVTVDTTIVGVGLDMYLGEQYPFYKAVQIPDYIIRKCRPEYIAVNTFQAIYRDRLPFEAEGRTLLDMMIQRGKEQYFLSKIVPFKGDTTRLGYSSAQLEWCEENEAMVYNFFVRDNLLYETNWQKILRYVNDGPSATGMPPASPGNIGTWLGFRIVSAYVEQHPGIGLNDLLKPGDAQRFLQESKYKPR